MTKFLNISKDSTLGNTTPSDILVSSQKAIKTYVDNALIPTYKIAGRVNFSELPQSLTDEMIGNVYSVNDPFTSDSRFVINGANYTQGTNVVVIETTEDIIYYGYYSSDSGETIYTLVAPTSLASNDKVYSQVQGEMVEVGYVSYCESYDDYCTIYSWIDNDSNEHYDYNEYNESYNISIPGTTPVLRYDSLGGANTSASINTTDNYVPYRSDSTTFSDSSLMYNSSAMAFTGKLHIGSSSPSSHASKGRLTIYDNTPSQQVSSIALLNYGGGGGCGVSIDMYNTSANGGIPSGRFGVIDNGNYSGYLQLQVKKSGFPNNTLLPAMNIVPLPVTNSLTTCVSFGQDEFNRVLFDLHKPESYVYFSDSDKKWSGSGTTYTQSGPTTFNGRLIVAVDDIVSFDNFSTEARVVDIVSSSSTLQITTDVSLGSISNQNIYVKKAYFKITDENYNTKVLIDPYGKMCIGKTKPDYELDVAGNINASTDIKINGVSVALPNQSGNSGKFLTTNGTAASWADIPEELPAQSGQSGKVLTTNGTSVSWTNFPTVDQTYSGTSTNAQSGVAVKQAIDVAVSSAYKAAGSVTFANLPTLGSSIEGNVYNVSDAFTTTSDFVEGAGKTYPAGTNVVCIDVGSSTYKWDVLAGFVDLSGYQTLIDSTHKLSSDLVDDTNKTNKFVTTTDITNWNGKVDANTAITGATKCKITYDSKGLVTSGSDLTASDIPSITLSKISDVTATAAEVNVLDGITATTTELNYVDGVTSSIQTQLNNKVTGNTAITGATKCKITYDSKGLVTAGADLSASDIPDISATYQTKLSSTNTLNADYISDGTTNKTVTETEKSTWSGKQDELVSGTNIKTINSTSLLGSGDISITGLPSQTSQSGKYLTTNGTSASWADLPKEVEWATYRTTTYQQVKDWYDAGKIVYVKYAISETFTRIFKLESVQDSTNKYFSFSCVQDKQNFMLTLNSSTGWSTNSRTYQESIPAGTSGNIVTYTGTAGTVGSATINDIVPTQTGNSGKFLTTNGSAVSWGEIAEYTANEVETLWDSIT